MKVDRCYNELDSKKQSSVMFFSSVLGIEQVSGPELQFQVSPLLDMPSLRPPHPLQVADSLTLHCSRSHCL